MVSPGVLTPTPPHWRHRGACLLFSGAMWCRKSCCGLRRAEPDWLELEIFTTCHFLPYQCGVGQPASQGMCQQFSSPFDLQRMQMRKMKTDHNRLCCHGIILLCGNSAVGQGSSPLPFLPLLTRRALLHHISNPSFVLEGESLICIITRGAKICFAQSKGSEWI